MADKKISQLVERLTTASTDVFPVVFVGATETQKVKASTIYTYIKNTLVSGIIQATTDTDKFLVQDGAEIKYRTGAEVLNDVLPNQSGNTGKVLKTDGTTASWQTESGSTTPLVAIPFSTDHITATGNQYLIGDVVYYAGNVYRCIANNDSLLPTNTLYWVNLGAGFPLVERPIDWNATTGNNQILNKPTIPTTPTLQQVTDVGLQTNDTIKLENGLDIYDGANAQWIEMRGGDNYVSLKIASALQDFFVAEVGNITIKDGVNKSAIINVNNIAPSTTKTLSLPNANGTLALSVNGMSADANGDINVNVTGSQNLQEVTDIGNDTTNDVLIGYRLLITDDASGLRDLKIKSNNNGSLVIENSSGIEYLFISTYLSNARSYELPDTDGTFTLSVNGVTPNAVTGDITLPTGTTLTLQDVTDNGNTTTNDIQINSTNGLCLYDPFVAGYTSLNAQSDTLIFKQLGGVNTILESGITQLKFGEIIKAIFDNTLLTASRTFNLPNSNGTLVLSVNGTSPNSLGEITIPVGGSQTLQQTTDLGNTTTNDIALIDASVTGIDNLDFDLTPATTTHLEGRVRWNDNNKTLQIDTENTDVSIDVGHDLIQRVVNNTGATLNKGAVVYINGQQGGRPTITLADNSSDLTSATTFGIVMSNIPNNQNGYVITNGLLNDINTSSFTAGQQLYLGSTGTLTGTKPVQPLHIVYVAKVISASVNGSIFLQVQNGLELEELHDCLITSPANGQLLTYELSTGLWKNQNAPTELPPQTGENGKFLITNGTSASWSFPSRHYKLGFNNIANYVVNGGSGTQNLGGGTLGMSLTQNLQSMLYAISGTNYVINCRVITAEEFGGVANQLGLRVTYSSANGVFSTDQLLVAQRIGQFGSNFGIQIVNLNFNIPIQYNGANTDYFKFEVIMNRTAGGSTSVFHSELIFSV